MSGGSAPRRLNRRRPAIVQAYRPGARRRGLLKFTGRAAAFPRETDFSFWLQALKCAQGETRPRGISVALPSWRNHPGNGTYVLEGATMRRKPLAVMAAVALLAFFSIGV